MPSPCIPVQLSLSLLYIYLFVYQVQQPHTHPPSPPPPLSLSIAMASTQCSNNMNSIECHDFSMMSPMKFIAPVDDEIPAIDYSKLISDEPNQRFEAHELLAKACQDFGFFNLVNGVPARVVERTLNEISDFFASIEEQEKRKYLKKNSKDRIRWNANCNPGENREYMKIVAHPQFHCPPQPSTLREGLGDYFKSIREVGFGLARAISEILGFEESYIEKKFNLESGFDVAAMNLYPPCFQSKSSTGVSDHTDPGFFISLIQDADGGLKVLHHNGKWVNVKIPKNAVLIQIGDHLEILTNGKYKSHIHKVDVSNNEVKRITMATLHGPSLDSFVTPAKELVDQGHPIAYLGMTYKESILLNGFDEIDIQSSHEKLRLGSS